MKLAVILVNWNQHELTTECLCSLARSDFRDFRTVVVDNDSSDGSASRLAALFPWVTIVSATENLGFAGGCNLGADIAVAQGADTLLFLNNDTVVAPDLLDELATAAKARPDVDVFCPRIYYWSPPDFLWYGGGETDLRRTMGAVHTGQGERDLESHNAPHEVSFATGCAMMVRAHTFHAYGGFDRTFFAYCEDLDFCIRLLRDGRRILYAPTGKVWHKVSASTAGKDGDTFRTYLIARSRFLIQVRYGSVIDWLVFLPWWALGHQTRGALQRLARGDPSALRALAAGIRDGLLERAPSYAQAHVRAQ